MKKRVCFSILLFLVLGKIGAQSTFPDPGFVFDDTTIPIVKIYIDQDSLANLFYPDSLRSYHEYPVDFVFQRGQDSDTLNNVGFRLRGNTSRGSDKKSFKISFNSFDSGKKFYGLEKMNINGEHNDPSIVRSKLCWDFCRWAEIPSSRSNHVLFYVNDVYYGLFINVEHIDEEFVKSRFNNNNGNLYKCLYPADLVYKGSNPDLYKEEFWGDRAYQLKTNEAKDDYTGLANFIAKLNNSFGNGLLCELPKVFDVDGYLKVLAFDVLTSNWDGPLWNKNNFYLYHNPTDDRIYYIPYDVDNTFGIDWFGIDWANRNIYQWQNQNELRPLYSKILSIPEWKDRYSYYLNLFVSDYFNNDLLDPILDSIKGANLPHVIGDPLAGLDYGWDFNDYLQSYESGLGQHVPYGLKPFINVRVQSVQTQIQINDIAPIFKSVDLRFDDDSIFVECSIIDEINPNVQCVFIYNDGNNSNVELGLTQTSDDTWKGSLAINAMNEIYYSFRALDDEMQESFFPYCDQFYQRFTTHPTPQLFINEFMASNSAIVADENGEFDDWIEIYNAEDTAVYLGNKFLTDNLNNLEKWSLPNVTIEAKEFLLFWADNDEEQGDFHANFKLSSSGEEIAIVDERINNNSIIDNINYSSAEIDQSYGYAIDGEGEIISLGMATPNATNEYESNTEETKIDFSRLYIAPNPSNGEVYVHGINQGVIQLELLNSNGKKIISLSCDDISKSVLNLKTLGIPKGIYLVRLSNNEGQLTKKLIYL